MLLLSTIRLSESLSARLHIPLSHVEKTARARGDRETRRILHYGLYSALLGIRSITKVMLDSDL